MGLQIRKVLKDDNFDKSFNSSELKASHAFKWICENFLGNRNSTAYKGVQNLLAAYKEMQRQISLKVHFLDEAHI